MRSEVNPIRNKKAVFNNNRYRSGKTRNAMYGRHNMWALFKTTEKHKSWKEEIK